MMFSRGRILLRQLNAGVDNSGQHVVIFQMSSLTPAWCLICILAASVACSAGSVETMAALNFLSHVGSVGSGVGLFMLSGTFPSQESRYFSQNFEM